MPAATKPVPDGGTVPQTGTFAGHRIRRGDETPENKAIIDKLTMALMKEYEKIDKAFQVEMGTDDPKYQGTVTNTVDVAKDDDSTIATFDSSSQSDGFNSMIEQARATIVQSLEAGNTEEAKSFAFKFAASSIKAGF